MNIFSAFGLIFWGLLLVILDLRINGFDLLPDFVGYLLVALGCGGLAKLSRHFSTAGTLSWILLAMSLVSFALPRGLAGLYGFAHVAVDCAMIWFLLGGIMEFASAKDRPDLSQRAANRRIAYVALMGGLTLLGMIASNSSKDAATFVAILGLVAVIILLVMILHLIHRVKHELAANNSG